MNIYSELKNIQPELKECFFAFSNEQFQTAKVKPCFEGKTICSGGGGLYGTKEGLTELKNFYENRHKEIELKCFPQMVYDDEFINHECSYTCDDQEAFEIVVEYFGAERAKNEVKRRFNRSK